MKTEAEVILDSDEKIEDLHPDEISKRQEARRKRRMITQEEEAKLKRIHAEQVSALREQQE